MSSPSGSLQCSLSLNGLRLQVKLGYGAEERATPQFVKFEVRVSFQNVPEACFTDQLSDTACYAEISEVLRALCRREYRLIEHLGMQAFSSIQDKLPPGAHLDLRITKENPPIADLQNGASFCIRSEPAQVPQGKSSGQEFRP